MYDIIRPSFTCAYVHMASCRAVAVLAQCPATAGSTVVQAALKVSASATRRPASEMVIAV